ncbi:MAG TPA: hypothetical protein GX014_03795 [Firmicutes bacterium]|nr:hypothetical protein [Bacillota bacterium]HHT42505.1 hypothetical protein [Bacillota bacterium]
MIWTLAAGVFSYLSVAALLPIYQRQRAENYLGESVPSGLGYAFLLPAVLAMLLRAGASAQTLLFASTLLLFAALGAIDDSLGDSRRKGFRAHLSVQALSTGALKAWGGATSALVAAWLLDGSWLEVVLNAGLTALGANFLNLLDLRPGRAGKAFLLLALPLNFLPGGHVVPLRVLSASLLGYLPWDLKRRAMMGDTGANPLGAALGLAASGLPRALKMLVLVVLAVLNLAAEKVSFSKIIESNRVLHFLDQLGR